MRVPSLHVIDAPAQFGHLLHALHELLYSKLSQEKVAGEQKSRLSEIIIENFHFVLLYASKIIHFEWRPSRDKD